MFTVDLRCMDDKIRHAAVTHHSRTRRIALPTRASSTWRSSISTTPRRRHATRALQDTLAAAIGDLGGRAIRLPSGAGHDAQMMARLCPSAMMFVRCRGGISHNPAEFCAPADMGLAVAALIRFIERFKP